MVFCEAKCRHGQECDILISAERDHPRDGALFVHHAYDHHRFEDHTWSTRPGTMKSTARCEVKPTPGRVSADQPEDRVITVRIPGK